MGVKISELNAAAQASREHIFPVSKDGQTNKLSIQQVIDLALKDLADGAPEGLNTLKKIADQISGMTGMIAFFPTVIPPPGWMSAHGAVVSRETYINLFNVIGTKYGAGDGSTTFNLPDVRALFPRFWDGGRGIDAGRVLGSEQADQLKAHSHNIAYHHYNRSGGTLPAMGYVSSDGPNQGASLPHGGSETRPRNIALLGCIKY